MKVLITGANGQLGKCIYDVVEHIFITNNLNKEYYFVTRDDFDITNESSMINYMYCNFIPDCIINCAAYTNVEMAEYDEYNAFKVNSLGIKKLVDICEEHNIMLIHISTDYVYKTYFLDVCETNEIGPINIYGESKRDGELHIINSKLKNWYIFRTSWLYSEYDGNFVTKVINNYKKSHNLFGVVDEIGSPTYARKLAEYIIDMIEQIYWVDGEIKTIPTGIYNFSGIGYCSRYNFMQMIVDGISNGKNIVNPITQKQAEEMWHLKAKRPAQIIMNNNKIISVNKKFNRLPWFNDLAECLNRYDELQKRKTLKEPIK